jgi:hypothetical protein
MTRQALSPEQIELVAAHVHAGFQPAARSGVTRRNLLGLSEPRESLD